MISKLSYVIFLLAITISCTNEANNSSFVEDVKPTEINFLKSYYNSTLFLRNEYPLQRLNSRNDMIKIHFEERMGSPKTYHIEFLNEGKGQIKRFKIYYTEKSKNSFVTEGRIVNSIRNNQALNIWRELEEIIVSDELKDMEDHRDESWLDNRHFYILESKLGGEYFSLVHQPVDLRHPTLDDLISKIKSIQ